MVVHCSIPAWRIPWTEPDGLQSVGRKKLDTTERLTLSLSSDLEGLFHLSWSLKNYRQLCSHTKFHCLSESGFVTRRPGNKVCLPDFTRTFHLLEVK